MKERGRKKDEGMKNNSLRAMRSLTAYSLPNANDTIES
jgi:hypothetical protein